MTPREAAAAALAELLPTLPAALACPELTALRLPQGRGQVAQGPDTMPADQRLREFFRRHPNLGKRDRLQIGDWVFDVLRNLRLYAERVRSAHAARPERPAAVDALQALIDVAAESMAPARAMEPARADAPKAAAAAGLPEAALMEAGLPEAVRYSLPDWLWERLQASHGARTGAIAEALLQPATIDLRANLLVGKAQALQRRLADLGIEADSIGDVPTGLRVAGRPNLDKLELFEQGWFEIQDAGSQRIVDFCEARRGQLVVDFCAGAGGKTLALAAAMRNLGKVLAFDTGEARLARLLPRARRAGVDIVQPLRITGVDDPRLARYSHRADVVLVDAPCSGSGTLRRSPDLKWRLTPQRLLQHVGEQRAILAAAAALVKPGGRLVYATCSLLREENEEQVERFAGLGFELAESARWLPDEGPSGGFFAAKWVLRAPR